jgi:hypothetical protein
LRSSGFFFTLSANNSAPSSCSRSFTFSAHSGYLAAASSNRLASSWYFHLCSLSSSFSINLFRYSTETAPPVLNALTG